MAADRVGLNYPKGKISEPRSFLSLLYHYD